MKLPVPVNIITGALGVGKTSTVAHLLRSKPPGEKWALLVNEFGALGIDAALLEAELEEAAELEAAEAAAQAQAGQGRGQQEQPGQPGQLAGGGDSGARGSGASGLSPGGNTGTSTNSSSAGSSSANSSSSGYVVRELAGGCLCCTLSGPLGVAIAQLVRNAKPDRLIIEPSGLGHPAGLLDTLYGEHLRTALDVRAVVCLVDVRAAAAEAGGAAAAEAAGVSPAVPNETFQDQVNVADVLVGHKADLAAPQQLQAFWGWAAQLYPPKAQVLLASHGAVDPAVLDLPRAPVFRPLFNPQSHTSRRRAAQQRQRQSQGQPTAAGGAVSAPTALLAGLALDGAVGAASGEAADGGSGGTGSGGTGGDGAEAEVASQLQVQLAPRRPLRFPSHAPAALGAGQGQHQESAQQGLQGQGQQGQGQQVLQQVSCGWLFSAEDVFERQRLVELLAAVWPRVARLKGIFRVGKSSYVVPYRQQDAGCGGGGGGAGSGCDVGLRPISYRRESRLEIIVDSPGAAKVVGAASGEQPGGAPAAGEAGLGAAAAAADWDAVERALMSCLK